jgi:hypothetical protein
MHNSATFNIRILATFVDLMWLGVNSEGGCLQNAIQGTSQICNNEVVEQCVTPTHHGCPIYQLACNITNTMLRICAAGVELETFHSFVPFVPGFSVVLPLNR